MTRKTLFFSYDTYSYSEICLFPGLYRFELWGASGDDENHSYSRGAYVSGTIRFNEITDLYLYIGQHGRKGAPNSFNGGGAGSQKGYSGGGATDIRLIPNKTGYIESLLSRIIVAAGGGGTARNVEYIDEIIDNTSDNSNAGGLIGYKGELRWNRTHGHGVTITSAEGATQTKEGLNGECFVSNCDSNYPQPTDGKLGTGGNANNIWGGGGGGGYFGGGAGYVQGGIIGGGGGGSSFVSGCVGCVALSVESTFDGIIPLESNEHYSGKVFSDIVMKTGNDEFTSPQGDIEKGHFGNGAIRITLISFPSLMCNTHFHKSISLFVLILLQKN